MVFSRPCHRCGETYKPLTKANRMCKRCKEILHLRDRIRIMMKSMEEIRIKLENLK